MEEQQKWHLSQWHLFAQNFPALTVGSSGLQITWAVTTFWGMGKHLLPTAPVKTPLCLHQCPCKVKHILLCMWIRGRRAGEAHLISTDISCHCSEYWNYTQRQGSVSFLTQEPPGLLAVGCSRVGIRCTERVLFLIVAACCLSTGLPVDYFCFCLATEPISPAAEAVVMGADVIHQADLRGRGILR